MVINERLSKLRAKMGMSQAELSKRLGIARTTYSGYENGSREPDLAMLDKISSFFGVNVHWLVTGKNPVIDEEVEALVEKFSKLSESDQSTILDLIDRFKKE